MKIILILLIVIIIVLNILRIQAQVYERFKEGAAETMGRIVKKETRIDTGRSKKPEDNVLIYSYEVGGDSYSGEERVEYADLWQDAREGTELRVYYSKKDPTKSYPAALIDRRLGIASKVK